MIIRLKVFEQTLSIIDTRAIPRKGSKDYLVLHFLFSSDWKDLDKICYLQRGEVSQPIDVVDGLVEVPEWFTQQDSFDVTLFGKGGSQEVPTNVVSLRLEKSNTLWEQDAPEPQPSWLAKVIELNNHPPVPGKNGYWLLWDTDKGAYVESELPLPDVGSGGTSDHSKLINRDAADQHPMSAVTGLVDALDGKQPIGDYLTQDNLQSATNAALEQAKASGEFDGAPGKDGAPGPAGADGVGIQSVEQTTTSTEYGGTNVVTVTKTDGTTSTFEVRNGDGGGISTTAKNLLITILRSGIYTYDQSNNITALEASLGGSGGEEGPDVPVETTYAISNELINCTTSNSATSAKENAVYTATLTANDGYTLTGGTVTITMGGVDITDTAYADGVISIAAVTGDVEIFASAVVVQAEAALPEDGLIAYFDYRTTTYDNAGSGGKTTIAPTKGSGQLYTWANNSISAQNEYGLHPANLRKWEYDQNGGTNATALGNAFTVIQLTYGEAPSFGFNYANTGSYWSFYPQYINASGITAFAAAVNGGDFNSDNKYDYNFTVVRVDGATLTGIFDTSRTTYNGGDIDGFSRWLDTPYGNTIAKGDNKYCTAMAIYNRALTDTEIEAAREFMKTLEVTA